jgi:hypothetical protein
LKIDIQQDKLQINKKGKLPSGESEQNIIYYTENFKLLSLSLSLSLSSDAIFYDEM